MVTAPDLLRKSEDGQHHRQVRVASGGQEVCIRLLFAASITQSPARALVQNQGSRSLGTSLTRVQGAAQSKDRLKVLGAPAGLRSSTLSAIIAPHTCTCGAGQHRPPVGCFLCSRPSLFQGMLHKLGIWNVQRLAVRPHLSNAAPVLIM